MEQLSVEKVAKGLLSPRREPNPAKTVGQQIGPRVGGDVCKVTLGHTLVTLMFTRSNLGASFLWSQD